MTLSAPETRDVKRPARSASSRPGAVTVPRARQPARVRPPILWRNPLLAFVALLTAYAGLHVVLQDIIWWVVGGAFALLVFLATTVTRIFLRQRWIPPLVAIGASTLGITAAFAGDKAFLGLIPTFDSADRLNAVINAGWESIQEQRIPAQPDPGIVLLLSLTMIGAALFADIAISGIKTPALMAAPLLTLLGIPVAVRPDIVDPTWFVVTAVLFLVILRIGRRPASLPVVLLVGAITIGGGVLTPTFLPQVQEDPGPIGGGVQTGINPLINLGEDLRRGEAVVAVTYQSSAGGEYLRLATLETFNGRTWTPNLIENDEDNDVANFPNPPGLGVGVRADQETMDVQVGDIAGRWLPLPYPAESVTGTEGAWYWERTGLSARSPDAGVRGQQYTVEFLDVKPTLEDVSAAVPHAEANLSTLVLPARMPEVIAQTAQQIAGQYTTTYERAMALQDYFTSGDFTYSEDAPVDGGFDGTGVDIVAEFLNQKTGYCVHFASAMAIMARTLGIPSRVAVGFQPGESQTAAGITSYTVTSHDLHAWPELYFDGVGWLRFEPTPGRGELPDYSTPAVVDDPTTPQNEATPTAVPTTDATANPERPDQGQVDPGTGLTAGASSNPLPIVLGVLAGLIILGGFAPLITRTIMRRRRENAVRHGRDPAAAAWAELRDTARDYGWAAPDSETPRDFADRLAVVLSEQREQIAGFRSDVEESAFAPPGRGVPTVDELRSIRRSIARTVDRRDRLRAIFLPDSLVTRFRYDPDA